jgi:hypothetical protein
MKLLMSLTLLLFVAAMTYAAMGLEIANAVGKSIACANEKCVVGESVSCVNEICEVQTSNSSEIFTSRGNSNTIHSTMTELESDFDFEMDIFDRKMD